MGGLFFPTLAAKLSQNRGFVDGTLGRVKVNIENVVAFLGLLNAADLQLLKHAKDKFQLNVIEPSRSFGLDGHQKSTVGIGGYQW